MPEKVLSGLARAIDLGRDDLGAVDQIGKLPGSIHLCVCFLVSYFMHHAPGGGLGYSDIRIV